MKTQWAQHGMTGAQPRCTLSPDRAAKLEREQLTLAERNVRPMLYSLPGMGAVTGILLAAWIDPAHLFAWYLVLCATTIRFWFAEKFLELNAPTRAQVSRWHNALALGTLVSNSVWVMPQFLFYAQCSNTGQMFLFLIACCSLACSLVMVSPSTRMQWATIIPLGSAIIVPPLLEGEPLQYGLAGFGLILTLYMMHVAGNMHASARELFLAREDKNDLIEQLAAAKFESDKARQRAEAASLAKSEFLANMSHELRTPLNAILGFSELMQRQIFGPLGAHQYNEYTSHISESGRQLLGLINEVLDLARIESGRISLRPVDINVRELARQSMRAFEVAASDRNIRLDLDLEPKLPLLNADERAAHQILLNLLSNAIKFTPAGGQVTIFARSQPSGELDLGVRDTGSGIDPADFDAVFAGFGQGRHDISSVKKGTGLGLPIVKGLVEAHGGKLLLQSELGKGTTLTCRFPRERVSAPQPSPARHFELH
jgi:two-component system cell cycle sensor histidine kinase PleC